MQHSNYFNKNLHLIYDDSASCCISQHRTNFQWEAVSLPSSDYPTINIIPFRASALLGVSHSPPCMSQSKQIGWNKAKHACPWTELYVAKRPPTDPHVSQSGVQTSRCSSPCSANAVLRTELICRRLFIWFQLSVQKNVSFCITPNQDGRSETKMRRSKKTTTPQCSIMYPIVYITVHIDVQVATHFELHMHTQRGWWHEEEQVLLLEGGRMNPFI